MNRRERRISIMHKTNTKKYIALAVLLTAWLWIGACSGSGSGDPFVPGPGGDANDTLGSLSGTLVDREGFPVGGFDTEISLTSEQGIKVAPIFNPPASGPEAGQFLIQNLPLGQKLFFVAEHQNQSVGRYIGFEQTITFSSPGTINLGNVLLDNPWLELGWNSYKQKDYTQALVYFNRALTSRKISANGDDDLTKSSSALTGIAWVHGKRGKDNQGSGNPMFPGFEWDQAINEFEDAQSNFNDADAWVGWAGTKLTLLADVHSDPVQVGPWLPMYGLVKSHFSDVYGGLQKALVADPNYTCEHDLIYTDDLKITQLFITWVLEGNVPLSEVEFMVDNAHMNEGSMQLLAIMPDLIMYDPFPQK
jgi:hypothetical protein